MKFSVHKICFMAYTWIRYGKPDPTLSMNGALAGLVAICTGVAEVSYVGSILIGLIAGILLPISVSVMDNKFHVDDPAGAISLHGCSGFTGVWLAGVFSTKNGLLYGGGLARLGAQLLGDVVIVATTAALVFLFITLLKKTLGIRVSREIELKGLDITEHGMEAYPTM